MNRISNEWYPNRYFFNHGDTVNVLFTAQCANERLFFSQYFSGKICLLAHPIMKKSLSGMKYRSVGKSNGVPTFRIY